MSYNSGSFLSAVVWMFVLSILLFWLPILGPVIAGFVGGRKAGSLGNAILAALLPGFLIGAAFFFFASLITGFPLFGFLAGLGGFAVAAIHFLPLLLGAILGALL